MKELKTTNELNDVLNNGNNILIKFGQPGCMPCKIVNESLKNIENEIKLDYYNTENIDVAIDRGYTKLPAIVLKANGVENTLTDNSILMDEDELTSWITDKLKK